MFDTNTLHWSYLPITLEIKTLESKTKLYFLLCHVTTAGHLNYSKCKLLSAQYMVVIIHIRAVRSSGPKLDWYQSKETKKINF